MRKARISLVVVLIIFALAPDALGQSRKKTKPKKKSLAELVFERAPDLRGTGDNDAPENTSLGKQNELADAYNLPRIKDDDELQALIKSGFLTSVPDKERYFYLDGRLLKKLRYAAPDALRWIRKFSRDRSEKFGTAKKPRRTKISSLVRTEKHHKKLTRIVRGRQVNPNAASGETPEKRTVHTTGYAFDISAKGLTRAEILWFADYLEKDIKSGVILAIYEYKASHNFHVFVIPTAILIDRE
ncbi:MAG: DUF5715 family protein [Candidatus Liptonbacteria bacterium]|nr:DUF5715 family protein [Candidatus Liptonbacteria bacterium]